MADEEDIERELRAELDEDEPDEDEGSREPCERCGDFHVAGHMVELDGGLHCEDCVEAMFDRPWSPGLLAGISFFLGFGAAGVLSEINKRRMGLDVSVVLRSVGWLAAFVVVLLIAAALPEGLGRGAGIGVNVAGLMFFRQRDASRFAAFQESGGQKGSALAAIGIGIGLTALSMGGLFVISVALVWLGIL